MENKVSLLSDAFACVDNVNKLKKAENFADERVAIENNKVFSKGYSILILLLVVFSILSERIGFDLKSEYLFFMIGAVSYCMLLMLCKKVAIKGDGNGIALIIWSIVCLPLNIMTMMMDLIGNLDLPKFSPIISVIVVLVVPFLVAGLIAVVLYMIANAVYKKANM